MIFHSERETPPSREARLDKSWCRYEHEQPQGRSRHADWRALER